MLSKKWGKVRQIEGLTTYSENLMHLFWHYGLIRFFWVTDIYFFMLRHFCHCFLGMVNLANMYKPLNAYLCPLKLQLLYKKKIPVISSIYLTTLIVRNLLQVTFSKAHSFVVAILFQVFFFFFLSFLIIFVLSGTGMF